MNIALTGATTDLGKSILTHLSRTHTIGMLTQPGFTYDAAILGRFFKDKDALVHCAAELDLTPKKLEEYVAINALLTGLLASLSARAPRPPKFIYMSSAMVYQLPDDDAITRLARQFAVFCQEAAARDGQCDLLRLARRFIAQNNWFPFARYNGYTLTKYLGEAAALALPGAAVLRVSNAYGPGYDDPRLIPRLIMGRLTGRGASYIKERRDFVYCEDINRLVGAVLKRDIAGVIDCCSNELTSVKQVRDTIVRLTPTAYGKLVGNQTAPKVSHGTLAAPADANLPDIIGSPQPFGEGLAATLLYHKAQCYHQMTHTHQMDEFLAPGERLLEDLRGSSAAYLFVVQDRRGQRNVRKIAIRDGVEGNGIAKVANEIRFYKHIARHKPGLARLYPKLLSAQTGSSFSSETIEYLEGPNYYAALRSEDRPFAVYRRSFERFAAVLCAGAVGRTSPIADSEAALNAYYLERSLSRLHSIDALLTRGDHMRINGRDVPAPHIILGKLLNDKRLRATLLPRIECFCFHGDLTLLNTVFLTETEEIRLIDPRGSTGNWDPLYDIAKLKFTLSGFGEFIIGDQPMVTQAKNGEYGIDFSRIPPLVRRLHNDFLSLFEQNAHFQQKIARLEPHWKRRIEFAEATHYLADIPFRLFTDSSSWTAVSSYVVGAYYLNQVYEELTA